MNDGSRAGGTTGERMWDGKRVTTGRRRRRLTPGVITLSAIMILSAMALSFSPGVLASGPGSSPDCQSSPGSTNGDSAPLPGCGGGGGGCTPTDYGPVSITNIIISSNPTVSTISFDVTPEGLGTTLYWGNTTSYAYPSDYLGASSTYSVTLNYLEPSESSYYFTSDYYYKISALPPAETCTTEYTTGTATGSWPMPTESGSSISGTVYGPTTGTTAPAGVLVYVTCARPYDAAVAAWDNYGTTDSAGQYSVYLDPTSSGLAECDSWGAAYTGFSVALENGYGDAASSGDTTWTSHWNETIVVWAPQTVNFYLAAALESSTAVVSAMEFTHTDFAQVSFCKDTSSSAEFEATNSQSGSLYGVSYSATSTSSYSSNFGSSTCIAGQGEPGFEAWGYPSVAGDVMFNAITDRSTSTPWSQYYLPLSDAASGNATGAPIEDWLSEPTTESGACVNSLGAYMFHYMIPANSAPQTFDFFAGGSVSGVSGENFGVSLPLTADPFGGITVSASWGYTLTTTLSSEFYASVVIPGPVASTNYFTVACSPSSTSETGIVLHVWQDSGPG